MKSTSKQNRSPEDDIERYEQLRSEAETTLDEPLTNRAFLLGCAHLGRMLYETCDVDNLSSDSDSRCEEERFDDLCEAFVDGKARDEEMRQEIKGQPNNQKHHEN
jgi:hypothetical protein